MAVAALRHRVTVDKERAIRAQPSRQQTEERVEVTPDESDLPEHEGCRHDDRRTDAKAGGDSRPRGQ